MCCVLWQRERERLLPVCAGIHKQNPTQACLSVCVCVCQQECAAANANAKSKWESADTVRESPRKEATRALSRLRSLVVCGRIGIHTHKTHHNHAPLGQRRCRRRLGAAAAEQRRIQLPQSKERAPRIFLLYFKLLMSGLFSY